MTDEKLGEIKARLSAAKMGPYRSIVPDYEKNIEIEHEDGFFFMAGEVEFDLFKHCTVDITELIAEVQRLRDISEWRPIKTAPKEGRRKLELFVRKGFVPVFGFWFDDDGEGFWGYLDEYGSATRFDPQPSHWRYLPEDPA